MRDNIDSGGWGARGDLRPMEFIRTEAQVSRHASFAPEPLVVSRDFSRQHEMSARTLQLAVPPGWALAEGRPCADKAPTAHGVDPYDTSDEAKAAALCAGCPVLQACREAALREEHGLSAGGRYLVRGGLTPSQRAQLTPTG